jgi:glycerate kinase
MMQALGLCLTDATGAELSPGGAALERLHHVDAARLDARLSSVELVLACDVDNPLLGPNGAAAVYGPQKGASGADVARLERGLQRWARITRRATGRSVAAVPGAGAAGGTAFAALAYLGAELRSGAELVLEMLSFDRVLRGATLVVTGEGAFDAQTLRGKAPSEVQRAAAAQGVPVVVVAGRAVLSSSETRHSGFARVFELRAYEPDVNRSMRDAASLLHRTGAAVARTMLR